MTSMAPYIKDVVLENNFSIPNWMHQSIDVLEKINLGLYYRTYKITTYANPRDAVIMGGALYSGAWFLGLSEYLKVAIYIKCALDLCSRYEQLQESCQAFNDAIKFKYPLYHVVEWELQNTHFSPSSAIWWQTNLEKYKQQTIKVIKCAFKVFVEIFKLALYLRDLYLLTQDDPMIQFYACSELADDLNNHCSRLKRNMLILSEQLRSQEALGNRLLKKMGLKMDVSSLIDKMTKENPHLLVQMERHLQRVKEDFRMVYQRGGVNFEIGYDRPREMVKDRFVCYNGQEWIDEYFEQQKQINASVRKLCPKFPFLTTDIRSPLKKVLGRFEEWACIDQTTLEIDF